MTPMTTEQYEAGRNSIEIVSRRRPLLRRPERNDAWDHYDLPQDVWHDLDGVRLYRYNVSAFWAREVRDGVLELWSRGDSNRMERVGEIAADDALDYMRWLDHHDTCFRHAQGNRLPHVRSREELSTIEADLWNRKNLVGTAVCYLDVSGYTPDRTTSVARYDAVKSEAVVDCELAAAVHKIPVPVSMCSLVVDLGARVNDSGRSCPHCGVTARFHFKHCRCAIFGLPPGPEVEEEKGYRRGFSQALGAAARELRRRYGASPIIDDLDAFTLSAYRHRQLPAPHLGYDSFVLHHAHEPEPDESEFEEDEDEQDVDGN